MLPLRPILIIPARLASTRLPQKMLAPIKGEPLIAHVWRRAAASRLEHIYVACDSEQVAEAVERAGGKWVMTDPGLPSGSDRVHAALQALDPAGGQFDIAINLQGDMPTFDPASITPLLALFNDPAVDIATLVAPMTDPAEITDPGIVKAVLALHDERTGRALYFSRSPVPYGEGVCYHHIGIYAFRRAALKRFVALPPSPLEKRERLEQLRAMEAGMRIDAAIVDRAAQGIDLPEHLEKIRQQM